MKWSIVSVLLALSSLAGVAAADGLAGRYTGVLHHVDIAQDQLVRLDVVTERESAGIVRARANMVLYFGGFDSDEYSSFDFENVVFNTETGVLVFDSPEREFQFEVKDFKDGTIRATVQTGIGASGELILTKGDTVNPERPLVGPIWGEYVGICRGVQERLQFQTTPPSEVTTGRSDRFALFGIRAQRGESGERCVAGIGTCVTSVFDAGDYDYFSGHLSLRGKNGTLLCDVDADGMTCDGCRYQRASSGTETPSRLRVPSSTPNWRIPQRDTETTTRSDISGLYRGFLHLERRDLYQPLSIQISNYRRIPEGGATEVPMVSLVANVKFGGSSATDQAISTKFDPRPLKETNRAIVFDRADRGSDTIIKIVAIRGSVIEGEWHSRRFGRVGTFAVALSGNIDLGVDTLIAPSPTGNFSNDDWNLSLQVVFSDNPATARDPFSPLALHGWARFRNLTPRYHVTRSAYDPFTGKFWIELGDHGFMAGKRVKGGVLISRPTSGILRLMQPHGMISLTELKD